MPDRLSARALPRATTAADSPCSGFQRAVETLGDGAQDLYSRVVLILCFDQRPRRDLGAGTIDHGADVYCVLIPLFAIAPVFGGDLEALECGVLAGPEASQLLRLADLQPELDDDRVAGCELFLELVDLVVGTHPLIDGAITFHPLDQHPTVPGAIENHDPAVRRNVTPEAPQIGLRALFLGRRGDRHGDVLPRIERAGDAPNRAAFAGSVRALEDKDQRMMREALVARQFRQLALVLLQLALVVFAGKLLGQVEVADQLDVVEHRRRRGGHGMLERRLSGRRRHLDDRLHGIEKDLAHGEIAIALVGALDHIPGRLAGGRLAQQMLPQRVRLVVDAISLPVGGSHAPARARVILQCIQSLLLLCLGKMDPEFEQQSAFVAEHLLVLANGLHVRMKTVVVDLAARARCFAHRFVVPGVEKDSELALGRKRAPIPPRRRSLRLLGRARTERDDADKTRIHPFGQLVRGFAAAARVNPRKNDQNRAAPGLGKIELRVQQRLAQRRFLARIDLLRDLVTDFRRFEHGSLPRILSARTAWPWRTCARRDRHRKGSMPRHRRASRERYRHRGEAARCEHAAQARRGSARRLPGHSGSPAPPAACRERRDSPWCGSREKAARKLPRRSEASWPRSGPGGARRGIPAADACRVCRAVERVVRGCLSPGFAPSHAAPDRRRAIPAPRVARPRRAADAAVAATRWWRRPRQYARAQGG